MRFITLLSGLVIFAQSAFADMKIPRSVFEMEALDEAKAEAAEEGKPIVFVLTDPGTT